MWKILPVGAKILIVIAAVLLFIGALDDYITFIPKSTSLFLMAVGSITMFILWFKYGKVIKENNEDRR